jgi:hypothetical protein
MNVLPHANGAIPIGPEYLTYTSAYKDPSGAPALRIWKMAAGAFLHLAYFDGVQFWMNREGSEIWVVWPATLTIEDAATYLLGPVLGLLLRLRGVTCLHASAISIGNCALAFVGAPGAGKSTTAAAFAQRGFAVVSDDVVALVERNGGGVFIHPAYPYLCLWPDSVAMVCGSDKILPSLSPGWQKRLLSLPNNHLKFEEKAVPLGAIFFLGERSSEPSAPFSEHLTTNESLLALIVNSYATNLLDKNMRASEFALFGRMIRSVPMRCLRLHQDASEVDSLCDVILQAFKNIKNKSLSTTRSV